MNQIHHWIAGTELKGASDRTGDVYDPATGQISGKVDFAKVRATSHFKNGVERLRQGVQKGFVIALMCSEGEPFDCAY